MPQDPLQVPAAVLEAFESADRERLGGRLDEEAYKPRRLAVGGHRQRGGEAMMLRLRVPGGRLSLDAFKAAMDLAVRHSATGRVHLTLRQDLQVYGIAPLDLAEAVRTARERGLFSYASGGSTVRNVTCAVLALESGAPFDPYPDALALSRRLARHPLFNALPRKFKIGFGAPGPERAQAWLNDLGFLPLLKDGREGYRVIAGGGLGASPHNGLELEPFLPRHRVGAWAEAVLELFAAHAPAGQPQRNRFKFVLRALGLEAVRAALPLAAALKPSDVPPPAGVLPDGQALWIQPPLGELKAGRWPLLLGQLRAAGAREIRVSFDQRLYVPGLDPARLPEVLAAFDRLGIPASAGRGEAVVVSCTGPDSCNRGLVNSQALARALLGDEAGWPSTLHVSGCPNGCSQHLSAPLSLQGLARSGAEGRYPAYSLRAGGRTGEDGLHFGAVLATWPANRVLPALRSLRAAWKAEGPGQAFAAWLEGLGPEGVRAHTLDHAQPQSREDYRDVGSEKAFETALGASECH